MNSSRHDTSFVSDLDPPKEGTIYDCSKQEDMNTLRERGFSPFLLRTEPMEGREASYFDSMAVSRTEGSNDGSPGGSVEGAEDRGRSGRGVSDFGPLVRAATQCSELSQDSEPDPGDGHLPVNPIHAQERKRSNSPLYWEFRGTQQAEFIGLTVERPPMGNASKVSKIASAGDATGGGKSTPDPAKRA